jgi:Ca-activated chloride channel family protein
MHRPISHRRILICAGVASTLALAAVSAQIPSDRRLRGQIFKIGTDTVALNVTVTTAAGYVTNLAPADFVVRDNGIRQDVTVFGQADVPLDVLLLIDTSASIGGRVPLLRAAARELFQTLGPDDRAAAMEFNTRLNVLSDWTSDRQALERTLASVSSEGDTKLYTALYVGLEKVARDISDGAGWRRRAIVVLSDGIDTQSALAFDDVLDACRRTSTLIYTVRISDPPTRRQFPVWKPRKLVSRDKDPSYVMTTLASETGGRAFTIWAFDELPALFRQIAVDLRHQYLLGYPAPTPIAGDPSFRLIDVQVRSVDEARVRARRGYYASTSTRTGAPTSP